MQEDNVALVWDDLQKGDQIYQIFIADNFIDDLIDDMCFKYPNGLDLDVFEKNIEVKLKKNPPGIPVKDIVRTDKGYTIFFGDTKYFEISLQCFFEEGSIWFHSATVLDIKEAKEEDLGLIFIGVSLDEIYSGLVSRLHEEYEFTVNNQFEINFEDD